MKTLHTTIMRRIYYAYALALAFHPLTLHVLALSVAGYLLARLVHVAVIYHSLLEGRVGEVGSYIVTMVRYADGATLAVMTVAMLLGISFLWQLRTYVFSRHDSVTLGYVRLGTM